MDDNSHVFLIKDKIRCIQKKIMDQLAADLNNALNDTNTLSTSLSNIPMASSSTTSISKVKRRRKRPINNDVQQQKTEASDSTTPENSNNRTHHNNQLMSSDGDDILMTSKTQSSSFIVASESDSASQTDEIQRRRRTFKKPIIPSTSQNEQNIKTTRCSNIKLSNSKINPTITNPSVRRQRRNCRSKSNSRLINIDENPSTQTSFSCSFNDTNYVGKRKRSRAIIHDDFRLRNHCLHDYDITYVDDGNLANFSSGSSLNLSDSDKDPCLTSNEADDEQSDWPRDESCIPRVISWWKNNKNNDKKSDDDDDDDDDDENNKMLTTNDGTIQKIVNGALSMVLSNNRIRTFVHREMLTGNRRNVEAKNTYTHPHPKRHIRLLKESRRSHHNSYSHKRVKNDHYQHKHNETIEPIDSTNINPRLLEKIGWTPNNQDGSTTSLQIDYRHYTQGLGYENSSMDTTERMESEQSGQPSQL